jgi:hypothetical protein|tara:strand:- start:44 stop:991 length:948 start_codon:yes stop_codon:yes gene_type:complete
MSKPTLLLSYGCGWAGTSPLAYTLQRYAKYCHGGYTKKFDYLREYIDKFIFNKDIPYRSTPLDIVSRIKARTWENYESYRGHKMNLTQDMDPIRDLSLEHITKLYNQPYTLDKYIEYNKNLWEHLKPQGYKAVADFTMQSFRDLRDPRVVGMFRTLQEHFNIKILKIVRDPIRRAFSSAVFSRAIGQPDHLYVYCYTQAFESIKSVFGEQNCHMIVMEELWEGSGRAQRKLSDFLDHPIDKLWKNLYCPDVGPYLKYDPITPCQSLGQDLEELTPEKYYNYMEQYKYVYDNWKARYGILPRYWGRPIDYRKNAGL